MDFKKIFTRKKTPLAAVRIAYIPTGKNKSETEIEIDGDPVRVLYIVNVTKEQLERLVKHGKKTIN